MDDVSTKLRIFVLAVLLAVLVGIPGAAAADARVWVNTNSGVYHCPGGQYYGNTKHGEYLPESQAIARGHHAAYGQRCSGSGASPAAAPSRFLAAPSAGTGTKVWVNPGSHVYHCPGTRYYGATKRGSYMSESEAAAQGNRPAYGVGC